MTESLCPDRDVLLALFEGKLSEAELDTLSSHVETCQRCVDVLGEFGRPSRTRSATPLAAASSDNQRYEVLRSHAHGGLGEVYVALDRELHREVALKRIHRRLNDNGEAAARFVREAEVTGGLEHPGIAPVYSLGIDAQGSRYYTMRFIRGDSLRDAIKKFHASAASAKPVPALAYQGVEFRKLVQRLIEVCNVIGYAHSRKILHRDIKPANIMLGRYGETLVVDWGLARPIGEVETPSESSLGPLVSDDSEVTMTRDGAVIGTPAYMSPEQATGKLRELTVRSDIYSLGATLYAILVGRAPFDEANVVRLLEQVKRGEFGRPRASQPAVPRRLEAICLKAMANDPAQRYASCEAMVDDLEHYLADEPVSALPDGWSARAFRWMRRHRTLVTSGAAVVVVATIFLSITIALLAKANRDLVKTNEREQEATQRARQTYQLAKSALDDVIELQRDPRFQAGPLQDVRLHLQRVESGFYEKFVALKGDDPFFQYERAKAISQLASLKAYFDSHDTAISELETAVGILSDASLQGRSKLPLAECYDRLGSAYRMAGRFKEAIAATERSIAMVRAELKASPQDAAASSQLARVLTSLAGILDMVGRHEDAKLLLDEAINTRQPLLAADPDSERLQSDLAGAYRGMGTHYRFIGQPELAEPYIAKALPLYEALLRRSPNNENYQSELAMSMLDLALALDKRHAAETETAWLKVIALYEGLSQEHPKVIWYTTRLAECYNHLGDHYGPGPTHNMHKAVEAFRSAIRVLDSADQNVYFSQTFTLKALALSNLASLSNTLGRPKEEEEYLASLEQMLERLEELKPVGLDGDEPTGAFARAHEVGTLAWMYGSRARFRAQRDRWSDAVEDYLKRAELEPQQHWNWASSGPPLVIVGDLDRYRQHCREVLQRFGDTEDPVLAERTGKMCLLVPKPDELERAVALIDRALTKGADHQYIEWFRLAQGFAAYRQGKFDQAVQVLTKVILPERSGGEALAKLLIGMCNVQSGGGDEARQQVRAALTWLDDHPQATWAGDADWQIFKIMQAEAGQLLEAQ